jgi:hypothetical protein
MHNVPKIILSSSISRSSRNESKRLYTNTQFLPPFNSRLKIAKKHAISLLQMQASFTTQKKECIYLICLILMYKEIKSKSFNAPLLSIKRRVRCKCKRHEEKRIKTKNALKIVRYERKKVETCSNNNSIKDLTTNKHSRSTRKCGEQSKKRQGEREITQIVLTKKEYFNPNSRQ